MSMLNCNCHDFGKHHHHSCGCSKGHSFGQFHSHSHHLHHDFHHHGSCSRCGHGHGNHHFMDRCLCDDRFRIRLSGLRSSMAFRLRQLIGERVKVALEEEKIVQGRITFVGNDFIEIVVKVKKENHNHGFKKKVFLVQFDQIKWVERLDKFC
ncbi:hypothetical protein L2D08_11760 [Domibacillus sp. PGB-M46]|uniref:hypothetical protein n=1 Tax=Domibacillus sp. PGB-M46 TaxID=2910255 RepID=UPI001F5A4536|nr:hypothetical protein [Domibacillus sp. PGB-M46]MCI2255041.1 hypothetical protein [Domibacillus sp. PGB-M46]